MKKLIIPILLFALACSAQDSQKKKYYYVAASIDDWKTIINGLSNSELASSKMTPLIEVINGQVMYQLQHDSDSVKIVQDSIKTKHK